MLGDIHGMLGMIIVSIHVNVQEFRPSSHIVYPNFFYFLSMPYSVRYAYYHMQGSLETPTKKHVILSFQLKENTDFPSVQSSKENENIDEYCMFFVF